MSTENLKEPATQPKPDSQPGCPASGLLGATCHCKICEIFNGIEPWRVDLKEAVKNNPYGDTPERRMYALRDLAQIGQQCSELAAADPDYDPCHTVADQLKYSLERLRAPNT